MQENKPGFLPKRTKVRNFVAKKMIEQGKGEGPHGPKKGLKQYDPRERKHNKQSLKQLSRLGNLDDLDELDEEF